MPSVEHAEGLDEWQRIIASSFVPMRVFVHPVAGTKSTFAGTVDRVMLGSVVLSMVNSGPHIARRTEKDIRLHPADLYKISVQLENETHLLQDGRETVLRPGEAAVYDVTRPYELEFAAPSRSIVAHVPRPDFALSPSSVATITATSFLLPTELVRMIEATFESEEWSSSYSGVAYHRGLGLSHLLRAELLGHMQIDTADTSNLQIWSDIERYVAAHLSNPELNLGDVAQATFLSRRSMQRVFTHSNTTFSAWLRARRLERVHERLLTTTDPVSLIARECGFSSAPHFSRSFRTRYGVTASELRQGMPAGMP